MAPFASPRALVAAVDAQLDKMIREARYHPTPSRLLNDVLPGGGWLAVRYRVPPRGRARRRGARALARRALAGAARRRGRAAAV